MTDFMTYRRIFLLFYLIIVAAAVGQTTEEPKTAPKLAEDADRAFKAWLKSGDLAEIWRLPERDAVKRIDEISSQMRAYKDAEIALYDHLERELDGEIKLLGSATSNADTTIGKLIESSTEDLKAISWQQRTLHRELEAIANDSTPAAQETRSRLNERLELLSSLQQQAVQRASSYLERRNQLPDNATFARLAGLLQSQKEEFRELKVLTQHSEDQMNKVYDHLKNSVRPVVQTSEIHPRDAAEAARQNERKKKGGIWVMIDGEDAQSNSVTSSGKPSRLELSIRGIGTSKPQMQISLIVTFSDGIVSNITAPCSYFSEAQTIVCVPHEKQTSKVQMTFLHGVSLIQSSIPSLIETDVIGEDRIHRWSFHVRLHSQDSR